MVWNLFDQIKHSFNISFFTSIQILKSQKEKKTFINNNKRNSRNSLKCSKIHHQVSKTLSCIGQCFKSFEKIQKKKKNFIKKKFNKKNWPCCFFEYLFFLFTHCIIFLPIKGKPFKFLFTSPYPLFPINPFPDVKLKI